MNKLSGLLSLTVLAVVAGAGLPSHSPNAYSSESGTHTVRNPTAEAVRCNNLGTAYMNRQQFEQALQLFREASQLDPKLDVAKINQGIALANLQRHQPALSVLEEVVRHNQADAHAWYNLGLIYKDQGDSRKALEAFQRASQLAPSDADVFYFIGLMESQMGRQTEAITDFQHALKLNPFHASAGFGLSRAFQRTGQSGKASEYLAAFLHVTHSKLGTPMGRAYGDQGPLSLAEQSINVPQPSATTVPVRFADVTRESGLGFSLPSKSAGSVSGIGSGACFFDFDNDGRPDVFLANGGPEGGIALFHNSGNERFEDVTGKAGLDSKLHGIACAAADYDNDGRTDLVITTAAGVVILHNQGDSTFKDATTISGVDAKGPLIGATFIDYDHDGQLDLYLSSSEAGKNTLWHNSGNGRFRDVTGETGLAGSATTYGVIGTDFNNDRAIDLLFACNDKPQMFLNSREGKWAETALWRENSLAPVVAAATLDFDKDGWIDVALAHNGVPAITLWRNLSGKSVEQVQLPNLGWKRAWGIVAFDYDNDGWIDLAAVGEREDGRGEVRILRNQGEQGFKDVSSEVGLDAIKLVSPRALFAADVDGGGAVDLLITQDQGPPVLLRADGSQNNSLRIALQGLNDNKSAIGAKLEVFSGIMWQKWEISGSGYLSQSATDLTVGLGRERRADVIRLLWPTGVVQDEVRIIPGRLYKIKEIDRRGGSW